MKKLLFLIAFVMMFALTGCGKETSSSEEISSSTTSQTEVDKPKTSFTQVDETYKVEVKTLAKKTVTLSLSGFKDNKGANISYICTKNGDKFDLVITKTGIAEIDEYGVEGYVNVNLPCPATFGFTVNTQKSGAISGPYISIVYDTEKNRVLDESILFAESNNAIISISKDEAVYSAKLLTKVCNIFSEFIKANNL